MNHLLAWADLTEKQREVAVQFELSRLLQGTCEGDIEWGSSQHLFDAAMEKASAMQTPWFAGEYVMDVCGDLLRQAALSDAESALYVNPESDIWISRCPLPND